ncbi:MAG: septum formation protein Maf [Bryobacterales bacterium]|nr:septum formation protein Maf [Bryobacterales bacterium]
MLILASASPRRRELLLNAGIPFAVRVPNVDETVLPGENAIDYVRRMAERKALTVAIGPDEIALAADTTVCLGGAILGKPGSVGEAKMMLKVLSGKTHEVHSGICLRYGSRTLIDCATTRVTFATMTEEEIEEYASSGEPLDKAGAYGIQGLASRYVTGIEGDYFNVVGLPVSLVYRRMRELGWTPRELQDEDLPTEILDRL